MSRESAAPETSTPAGSDASEATDRLAARDPAIVAIASDVALKEAPVPVIDLDDIDGIVEILISRAVPLAAALARAGAA